MEKLKLISKVKYIRIILRPNLVEFSCIWILYGCLDAWPIKFSFCCYFAIGHGDLHQHLDFIFVVILLSMMIIYTSTLIFFLFILCYRSWRFTPAPWFVLVLLSIMVIYASALISFLLLFCYRSWLFTPAHWFSVVIDRGYLHQHLDFPFVVIFLSIMIIYTSTLILFLFCYRSWLFTPAPWFPFCCYFLIDHGYLHQHLDFLFVVILLSIMAIYTSTLILFFNLLSIMVIYASTLISFFLLFCYRSWLFTPAH